jgi:CRP-like cAMP-binding protein
VRPDLAGVELFAELSPRERDHLAQMMQPFAAQTGATLFCEGEPGDGLYLLSGGALRVVRPGPHGMAVPLATLGPGSVVGELSMLAGGTRTATVVVARAASGWHLARTAAPTALLRRISMLAVARMRDRYEAIAARLGAATEPGAFPGALPEARPEAGEFEHLRSTLLFAGMRREDVVDVTAGARRLFAARGARVLAPGVPPPALYVVVHGAVEVAIRGPELVQRVRLAGPGRAIGQLGLLGTVAGVAEARARERSVLLELPWPRLHALLDGATDAARAFVPAFGGDVARALRYAERPVAALRVAAGPVDAPLQQVRV